MYRTKQEMEQEIYEVKQLDICRIAENMGYTLKRRGSTYQAEENKGLTFFPSTNTFFHFYENRGGSVVDFVMVEKSISFPEAVKELRGYISGSSINLDYNYRKTVEYNNPKSKPDFILPPANDNYRRAFAYLNKTRMINAGLISMLMEQKRIYEEMKHHNVVFLATDKDGIVKHGFLRGTITDKQWRGDVPGSDKDYGFNIKGSDDMLVVFEAPIDALSYASINEYNTHHLLACGMLAYSPIDKYLSEHTSIKRIAFLLDNDKKGIEAQAKFTDMYKDRFQIINDPIYYKIQKSNVKDVNEYLIKYRKMNQELMKQHKNGVNKNEPRRQPF